jgi:predicted ester cyclase
MQQDDLSSIYRAYIACLNARDWQQLERFVADDVTHNGRPFGLAGYREMLAADVRAIPDLRFVVDLLFGLPVNGRRVRFAENVFYTFRDGRIGSVWSIIDTAAIAAQV